MLEKFRILIVDDDVLVLELMKHAARRHPQLKIEATTDSADAIERIKNNKPYHIILTDLAMPSFNGIQVLKEARMRSPDSRGIIVTGFGDRESTTEAIKLGVSDYLHKPFRIEELDLAIRNAIEHFNQLHNLAQARGEVDDLKKVIEEKQRKVDELTQRRDQLLALIEGYREPEKQPEPEEGTRTQGAHELGQGLMDLGRLRREKKISEQEFQAKRKSLIDKAYKSIIT
jgi:DNA-binding NtrC family response regulator